MATTATYSLEDLRTFDPNWRPPCMVNHYCPACSCRKSGDVDEPNGRDDGCGDETCACHREARCTCCDGHDGLGIHHFADVDALAAWLAGPHEQVCDIDIATVPDEPYGMEFVTAGEAAAWLDDYREREQFERAWERRFATGGRR